MPLPASATWKRSVPVPPAMRDVIALIAGGVRSSTQSRSR